MTMFKVRDRKTGITRTITRAAYAAMGPKTYEKLATVNDDGTEVAEESPNSTGPQFTRSVRAAGPVVSEKIPATETDEATEPEEKQPIFRMEDPQADPVPPAKTAAKTPAKRGPKPKSISSKSSGNAK